MCPYYNANVLQLTCATVLLTIRTTPPRETLLVPVLQYIRDNIVQYLRRFLHYLIWMAPTKSKSLIVNLKVTTVYSKTQVE